VVRPVGVPLGQIIEALGEGALNVPPSSLLREKRYSRAPVRRMAGGELHF